MKEKDPNFKVCLTKILEINPHPNPVVEKLQLARVYGFDVIIGKDSGYFVGKEIIYFPVNSILPGNIENLLFPPDAKIKLDKSRIKACKIQKFVSQGMIAPWESIKNLCNLPDFDLETDLQDQLGVVKYYPPQRGLAKTPGKVGTPRTKVHENEFFKEYKGCVNIKWEPHAFEETNVVWISEKVHGSNFRAGYMPFVPPPVPEPVPPTKWEKLKAWLKSFFKKEVPVEPVVYPEWEFCIGSNTVQRQRKLESPTWYGTDIYLEMAKKYDLIEKLKEHPGYIVFGEVYGPTVQKGYGYGLKNDERDLVVFDVMYQTKTETRWLPLTEALLFTKQLGLSFVPILYQGPWNKEVAEGFVGGSSAFCPQQKVREGIVVKNDDILTLNRKKIKIINPEYLMKEADGSTTDFQEEEFVEPQDLPEDKYV